MKTRLDARDSQGESSTLLVQQRMSRQGDPPDAKSRSIDQRREVSCSEGERHEASSNEKPSKRGRNVENGEEGRECRRMGSGTVNGGGDRVEERRMGEGNQEDNDGRQRERIDKVVDRIESDRIQQWEFPKCNHITPNARVCAMRHSSAGCV